MHRAVIPDIGAAKVWRDNARMFLARDIPPEQIIWQDTQSPPDLFGDNAPLVADASPCVPRSFVSLANTVVWHSDPERFARLYAFLWRLKSAPHLMSDRGDAHLAKLRTMEKNVRRCQHKMKAFVRFREIGTPDDARRSFAAWFEPTHHTVEPTAQFFVDRFSDMDWQILTPDVCAIFRDGQLSFEAGRPKPDLPEDASEQLWVTYFRNIFNPARLKVQAMQSEMPKKYWKNLPEAASIPDLIAGAPERARAMAAAAPSLPPARTGKVQAMSANNASTWDGPSGTLPAAISACTRCPLHNCATQSVLGEGPLDANLMIVGEQPGDAEDLSGKPFVGPAGQLFDHLTGQAGLDRQSAYVTNAVKHFKFLAKGRRRIHAQPNRSEIDHCRWWLDAEIAQIKPKLIVAMGATAAYALMGNGKDIRKRRGTLEQSQSGYAVLITYHPSYLLRLKAPQDEQDATQQFREDIALAQVVLKDL